MTGDRRKSLRVKGNYTRKYTIRMEKLEEGIRILCDRCGGNEDVKMDDWSHQAGQN